MSGDCAILKFFLQRRGKLDTLSSEHPTQQKFGMHTVVNIIFINKNYFVIIRRYGAQFILLLKIDEYGLPLFMVHNYVLFIYYLYYLKRYAYSHRDSKGSFY